MQTIVELFKITYFLLICAFVLSAFLFAISEINVKQ